MKTKLILAILLFSTFSTFGQKEMPSQFLGIGLNNIISLELNKTLNSNSLSSAPLNLVEFTYGIKYTPKRFGGFLDANYSIYGTDNSRTAMQSFKLDDEGFPVEVIIKTSKDAHKLVEEFMTFRSEIQIGTLLIMRLQILVLKPFLAFPWE